jgi:hypothetical protein
VSQHSAFLKLERAKHHLAELQRLLKSFYESAPCEILNRINPENETRREYYIANAKEPPDEILLVTGDILQNLRCALDHIAYALCSGSRKRRDRIYFPIAESKMKYEENKMDWTRGMSKDAKAKLDELKPYKGGNDVLWRLHKLSNIDKHRLLITTECCFVTLDVAPFLRETVDEDFRDLIRPAVFKMEPPVPLRDGELLTYDLPNANEKPIPFGFEIRIAESEVVSGENLFEVIAGSIKTVESVFESFAQTL